MAALSNSPRSIERGSIEADWQRRAGLWHKPLHVRLNVAPLKPSGIEEALDADRQATLSTFD